jgi:hypothetical protein
MDAVRDACDTRISRPPSRLDQRLHCWLRSFRANRLDNPLCCGRMCVRRVFEQLADWTSTPNSTSRPAIRTSVVSVTSASQLGDMVKWDATNNTAVAQLATCEVLVLNGSTQLGELGPMQLTVAAGATAEQYSEVTTLAGSTAGDTAQIVCQKG